MIWSRAAGVEDASLIEPILRAADRREIIRMGEGLAGPALRRTIERSRMAGIFFDGERPLAIFGVVEPSLLDATVAVPWMVGTIHVVNCKKSFLRETRAWVQAWRGHYRVLTNRVDAAYPQAIRWLRWLGFEIGAPEPFGLGGALFCRIEMRS